MNKFYKKLLLTLCALTVSTSAFCMEKDQYYTTKLKPQLKVVYDNCGKDGSGLLKNYLTEIKQPKYNQHCNRILDFLKERIEQHQARAAKGLPSKYFVLSQVFQEYNLWLATQPQALSVMGQLKGKENKGVFGKQFQQSQQQVLQMPYFYEEEQQNYQGNILIQHASQLSQETKEEIKGLFTKNAAFTVTQNNNSQQMSKPWIDIFGKPPQDAKQWFFGQYANTHEWMDAGLMPAVWLYNLFNNPSSDNNVVFNHFECYGFPNVSPKTNKIADQDEAALWYGILAGGQNDDKAISAYIGEGKSVLLNLRNFDSKNPNSASHYLAMVFTPGEHVVNVTIFNSINTGNTQEWQGKTQALQTWFNEQKFFGYKDVIVTYNFGSTQGRNGSCGLATSLLVGPFLQNGLGGINAKFNERKSKPDQQKAIEEDQFVNDMLNWMQKNKNTMENFLKK